MKVLFHINEEAKWQMVMDNVQNMLNYGQQNSTAFDIEIVADGVGVMGLVQTVAEKSKWYAQMEQLSQAGVKFMGCSNSLGKFNSSQTPLSMFATVIPSGVVEVALKQLDGYVYIRP